MEPTPNLPLIPALILLRGAQIMIFVIALIIGRTPFLLKVNVHRTRGPLEQRLKPFLTGQIWTKAWQGFYITVI